MPLTAKGTEIHQKMQEEYGAEKGNKVFYASKNAGKITGVDSERMAEFMTKIDALNKRISAREK